MLTCLWRQTLWHVSLAVFLVSCYTPITRDTCPFNMSRALPSLSVTLRHRGLHKISPTLPETRQSTLNRYIVLHLLSHSTSHRNIFFASGDIDPEFNVVEVTEEAKQELAKIENKIGDYICRLCKEVYDDAFGLAQHR